MILLEITLEEELRLCFNEILFASGFSLGLILGWLLSFCACEKTGNGGDDKDGGQ